jgi:hypothetical protein
MDPHRRAADRHDPVKFEPRSLTASARIVPIMRTVVFGRPGDPEFRAKFPVAYPVEARASLLGEMPVRLCAEGKVLAAYGFGGQRVEIPAESIRQVWIHPEYEAPGGRVREALLVLGVRHRVLLRAPGVWGPGVPEVCWQLGLRKQPEILGPGRASRAVPSLADADSCQCLRVRPAGGRVAPVAAGLGRVALCVGGGIGGVSLGLLFPASAGDARILVAIALGIAGALAGTRLYTASTRFAAGLIRWAVASRRAGTPASVGRFFQDSEASPWTGLVTSAVLGAAVPVLAIWGVAVEAITLSRGGTLSHGAALGNMIAGALAILLAPPLAWLAIRRFVAARHRVRDDFTSGIA